jgi:outer membrane protein assembly factor BamB
LYLGTADIFNGTELGFYAINRHTGKIVWEQRREGVFNFSGNTRGGSIFSDYRDFSYFDIELRHFFRNIELLDFLAPTVWKDLVIWTGGDCVARAFDANTGALRWERKFDTPVSSAPTLASGRVYFGVLGDENKNPRLVCLSARDGRLLWQMEIEGSILSAPVIAGKRIIFGTDLSVFYVLEQVF